MYAISRYGKVVEGQQERETEGVMARREGGWSLGKTISDWSTSVLAKS